MTNRIQLTTDLKQFGVDTVYTELTVADDSAGMGVVS